MNEPPAGALVMASRRRTLVRWGAFVLGSDLVTKFVAFQLLSGGHKIFLIDQEATLMLYLNRSGVGSSELYKSTLPLLSFRIHTAAIACAAVVGLLVFLVQRRETCGTAIERARRVVLFAASGGTYLTALAFFQLSPPEGAIYLGVRICSALGLSAALATYVRWPPLSILFAIVFAANLGNALNYILPPHAVIDFIYVDALHRSLGMGVFNLADVYLEVAMACLVPLLGFRWIQMLARRARRKNQWPNALPDGGPTSARPIDDSQPSL